MQPASTARKLSKERGFTLLELLAVIVIISIIAMVIVGNIRDGSTSSSAESESHVVSSLFSGMTATKNGGTYGPAGTDLANAMIQKGKIPGTYTVAGNTVTNGYGGAVTFLSAGTTAVMTENNYPSATCVAVVHLVSNLGTATVTVNGTSMGAGTVGDAQAANSCNQTGNANTVAIQSTI